MPKLSVITPVYNQEELLSVAIESVLQQTRLPDEYLILDDGSTDRTWEVIASYSSKHSFIRPIRFEKNQGLISGLNTLLKSVTSDYMFGIASDDCLHPEFCAKIFKAATAYPEAGIHFGSVWSMSIEGFIQDSSKRIFEPWNETTYLSPQIFLSDYLLKAPIQYSPSAATAYKMNALREVGGFRPELGHWTDTFAIQAIGLRHGACFLSDTGSYFRLSPNGFSQAQLKNSRFSLNIVERAAALMRSPEFQNVFPPEYVNRWEKLYREYIVERVLRRVSNRYNEVGREYCAAFPGATPQLARLLMKFGGVFRKLQLYCLRHVLNAYRD